MKYSLNILFLFTLLLSLGSCATSKKANYLQEPGLGVKSYPKADSLFLAQEYKLQVGDQLYIRIVSPNENASKVFRTGQIDALGDQEVMLELYTHTIYADSCIDYPYIGKIKLAGLTTREAKYKMTEKLLESIPECDVDVRLVNSYYTIIGDAGTGVYPIGREKLNIFQVLAMSGDLRTFSDRKRIHILRPTANGTEIKTFDVRSKDIINSEYYYVRPNDVIYVQSFHGQFWGISSFSVALTTVTSTLSFGVLIYNLCTRDWSETFKK
jgi:polysaccharide export outer membrane protein